LSDSNSDKGDVQTTLDHTHPWLGVTDHP
jgi:hypothetical protein